MQRTEMHQINQISAGESIRTTTPFIVLKCNEERAHEIFP